MRKKIDEYGRKPEQCIHRHKKIAVIFKNWVEFILYNVNYEIVNIDLREHSINAVLNNCRVID